eukprot:2307818-Prymnesium_polylepis.1
MVSAAACWCGSGTKPSTKWRCSTRSRRSPVSSTAAPFHPETHPFGSMAATNVGVASRIAR